MEDMRRRNEADTIDLLELFYALKRRILPILAAGLLFGCIACAYSKFFISPTYTSTSSLRVLSKETTLTSVADLTLGTQLTSDYQVLIKSKPVLKQVIENLDLNMSPAALKASVAIENPASTRILNLTVTSTDPAMAKKIVDELANVGAEYVGDKMEVIPPKIIEEGEIPTGKVGPNVKKNTMMGFLAGIVAAAGIVVLFVITNDTIKSEEDVTRYLGIPTLASVPDRKDYIGSKKKKSKRKKKKKKSAQEEQA